MNNRPTISIIVPVFNTKKYLAQCVDSILNNTFKDFECILIDDGSTDGSSELCDEYKAKDSRVIVVHKKNAGGSAARNDGLRIASGNYITFIDSDDYVSDNYFQSLIDNVTSNKTDAVMAKEIGVYFDSAGSISKTVDFTKENIREYVCEDSYIRFCKSKGFCDLATKLFKRELISNIWLDENLGWGEDFVFMYEMCCSHPHYLSTEMSALYFYRHQIDKPSSLRWQNKKMNNVIKRLDTIYLDYSSKNGKDISQSELAKFYNSCFMLRYNYCIKKFYVFQIISLFVYRFRYFKRNKKVRIFLYCFFPYLFRLLTLIRRGFVSHE